jgi:hypothetical protein
MGLSEFNAASFLRLKEMEDFERLRAVSNPVKSNLDGAAVTLKVNIRVINPITQAQPIAQDLRRICLPICDHINFLPACHFALK